jgi:hypothetical protein
MSCIFYQANTVENQARWQFYNGVIFGTPSVVINGIDDTNSNGVTTTVLDNITGNTSWLHVEVEETTGSTRSADITLQDHVGGSLATGKLFAVIVEREIQYNAPNGETLHHNVFRKFLSATGGDDVDMSSGSATVSYEYEVDQDWAADEVYVIAWLMDPVTKEIYNSGTRFDPDFVSAVNNTVKDSKFGLQPNPTSGVFTLTLPDGQHASHVSIFDATGATVHSQSIAAQSTIVLDGSTWPEGNYIVQLQVGDEKVYRWVSIFRS